MSGLFTIFIIIYVDFFLFFLLFLHITVQVANQELRVRLYVIHSQIEDVLSILIVKIWLKYAYGNLTEHEDM